MRLGAGWRGVAVTLLFPGGCAVGAAATAAAPVPVMVQAAPGRFEIASVDASAAHAVSGVAEQTWRLLAQPFALPAAFSSPVFVRLLEPGGSDGDARGSRSGGGGFGASVEAGGVVSVWIRWPASDARAVRRALVRGLLLRLAVAAHGAREQTAVPGWLELAAIGWCETRSDPAQLDALKYRARNRNAPALGEIFAGKLGDSTQLDAGAWLLAFLQGESTTAGEWPACLRRWLRGEPAVAALSEAFPGRFNSEVERELWWQTGWHHLRRMKTLPTLDAADSRAELAALMRFVFAPEEADIVVPLRRVLQAGDDPLVAVELKRRGAELGRRITALHPFYHNAGLSLAAAFEAATTRASAEQRDAACAQFESDWNDAVELEVAATAALDRMEREGR